LSLEDDDRRPHRVRHLVALESHAAGTRECVQLDADGTVRRIQRYYDSATWLFTSGVAASLIPVSCTLGGPDLPFTSLVDLRRSLAERGVPSHDVPIDGGAFDLNAEAGLVSLSEQIVLDYFSREDMDGWPEPGPGCDIHASAHVVGPVMLHDGVV